MSEEENVEATPVEEPVAPVEEAPVEETPPVSVDGEAVV